MNFNEYQKLARTTAIYPDLDNNLYYPTLGLCGEAGEVAEKIKKIMRDKNGITSLDDKKEISKEIGDCLWYLANICCELNITLDEAATYNIGKLQDRQSRNKLHGEGDNR